MPMRQGLLLGRQPAGLGLGVDGFARCINVGQCQGGGIYRGIIGQRQRVYQIIRVLPAGNIGRGKPNQPKPDRLGKAGPNGT
mgnify:CR=1 FL=1